MAIAISWAAKHFGLAAVALLALLSHTLLLPLPCNGLCMRVERAGFQLAAPCRIGVGMVRMASAADGASVVDAGRNPARRVHQNKYKRFSQNASDPLLDALKSAKRAEQAMHASSRVKATTVPVNTHAPSRPKPALLRPAAPLDPAAVVPSDPATYGYFEIGKIVGPHGLNGQLKLMLNAKLSNDSASFPILFVKKPFRRAPRRVRVVSMRKQTDLAYLLTLEGVTTRTLAATLKNYLVYVHAEQRPSPLADEFFIRDLVDCRCFLPGQETPIAVVTGVVLPEDLCDTVEASLVMHALLELRVLGSRNHCLLPFVSALVPEVDIERRTITICPPEGLLSLTYEVESKTVVRAFLPARIDRLSAVTRTHINEHVRLLHPPGGAPISFV